VAAEAAVDGRDGRELKLNAEEVEETLLEEEVGIRVGWKDWESYEEVVRKVVDERRWRRKLELELEPKQRK